MGLNGHGFDNFHCGLNEVVTELSWVDANWLNIANVHRLAARMKRNFKGRYTLVFSRTPQEHH